MKRIKENLAELKTIVQQMENATEEEFARLSTQASNLVISAHAHNVDVHTKTPGVYNPSKWAGAPNPVFQR